MSNLGNQELVANGDGTMSDRGAGLMWQKAHDGVERTQAEAFAYCRSLTLAGFNDWRLPTLSDFSSLGKKLGAHDYWTATDEPRLNANVAYINDGTTMYKTNKFYVRAVRNAR